MASPTGADDGFHEIQLSGKQLVFLFMATTVVSVVIFLCGVLVGRGVRAERPPDASIADTAPDAGAAPQGDVPPAEPPPPANDPAPPPAAGRAKPDELSYYSRLEGEAGQAPPKETLKPAPAPAGAPAATPVAPPATTPAPKTAAAAGGTASSTAPGAAPAADGYKVQVAALRERTEADAIVKRLTGKGYPAYVLPPAPGAPTAVYRVRVGNYRDRNEAEQIVRRLEKEEQFRPWITR